ncbi:Na+/H+ antiporter NhaA [soil metagenome]
MPKPLPSSSPTFLQSNRVLARVAKPVVDFLHIEASGGILLVCSTVAALVWANSPFRASYDSFWHTPIELHIGTYEFAEDFGHVVNDLLMAVFFFVVGMEIKRELVVGELRNRRAVALPAFAALGGMIAPAALYLAINANGDGGRGWGVPMATDIAFALGVVALLGRRVPSTVKVLLLTIAIVDDIGAIIVIAIFYSEDLDFRFLAAAGGVAALIFVMHRVRVVYAPVFVIAGVVLWFAVFESGIHATIAGVVMGLLTPARPSQTELEAEEVIDVLEGRPDLRVDEVRATAVAVRGSVSACDRQIDALHPWTSYFIVPVFALANAGIELSAGAFSSPSKVFLGVGVGLVVGKLVGITLFSWIAVRLGLGRLPAHSNWRHLIGVAAMAGIGFTVSLFIGGLAFVNDDLEADAKIGTLVASVVAAVIGSLVFMLGRTQSTEPVDL